MARAFLDTNVLVYADDADAGPKRETAQALVVAALATGDAVISTQVLQEYFAVATRKRASTQQPRPASTVPTQPLVSAGLPLSSRNKNSLNPWLVCSRSSEPLYDAVPPI